MDSNAIVVQNTPTDNINYSECKIILQPQHFISAQGFKDFWKIVKRTAKKHGIPLGKISATIHTYPSLSDVVRALGDAYMRTKLTPGTKSRLSRAFRWLRR